MTSFPLLKAADKNLGESFAGGKYLTNKCIFQYFEHYKSKIFPRPWWDIHVERKFVKDSRNKEVVIF